MDSTREEFIEVWKPIPGFEGFYSVSNTGRVRRDCGGGNNTFAGKIIKSNKDGRGYHQVGLCVDSIRRTFKVHILVALSFLGPRPEGLEINHIDGVKENNFVWNLEYITPVENMRHSFLMGRESAKGEDNGSSKLNSDDIINIRNEYLSGQFTQRDIAKKYNVHRSTIGRVISNRVWKHLLNTSA